VDKIVLAALAWYWRIVLAIEYPKISKRTNAKKLVIITGKLIAVLKACLNEACFTLINVNYMMMNRLDI
jgi:hypothetical protein